MSLSAFAAHALESLKNTHFRNGLPPSAVGQNLWEKSDPEKRKQHPSPQGLALLGSKFLRELKAAGLAHQSEHGWCILEAGRVQLQAQRKEPS